MLIKESFIQKSRQLLLYDFLIICILEERFLDLRWVATEKLRHIDGCEVDKEEWQHTDTDDNFCWQLQ